MASTPLVDFLSDSSDLQPLQEDAKNIIVSGQNLYKAKRMNKSAVILNSPVVAGQFKMLAIKSGIYKTERYIDASTNSNPIEKAINWVKDSIDPDN